MWVQTGGRAAILLQDFRKAWGAQFLAHSCPRPFFVHIEVCHSELFILFRKKTRRLISHHIQSRRLNEYRLIYDDIEQHPVLGARLRPGNASFCRNLRVRGLTRVVASFQQSNLKVTTREEIYKRNEGELTRRRRPGRCGKRDGRSDFTDNQEG